MVRRGEKRYWSCCFPQTSKVASLVKMVSSNYYKPWRSPIFLGVEAYSIAFLSRTSGLSQPSCSALSLERSISRNLYQLKYAAKAELKEFPNEIDEKPRIETGCVSLLLAENSSKESSKLGSSQYTRCGALTTAIAALAIITVMFLSEIAPPEGWQPRHCGLASIFFIWLSAMCSPLLFGALILALQDQVPAQARKWYHLHDYNFAGNYNHAPLTSVKSIHTGTGLLQVLLQRDERSKLVAAE
jgi:hypothetical protein